MADVENSVEKDDIKGLPQVHRYLKNTAFPTVFSWRRPVFMATIIAREQRYLKRSLRKYLFPSTSQKTIIYNVLSALPKEIIEEIPQVTDFQVEVEVKMISLNAISTQTTHLFRFLSLDDMLSDSKLVLFYTGLECITKFHLVYSTLLPMALHLQYKGSQVINSSVEDQFLLLLVMLGRNKPDYELANFFGFSTTPVGNIFVTWVNFVYELWSKINIWPSRCLVDYYMPEL